MASALARLRELPPELRNAGIAAGALALSLVLPWYEQSYAPKGRTRFVQRNVSAFGVFSFVEAAVPLVAAGVLFLVWARSEKKGFHLPGGDGTAIALAGGWALLLLVWRLFDKPELAGPEQPLRNPVGHVRRAARRGRAARDGVARARRHRPEPPNPIADEPEPAPAPRPPRRRADPAAVTDVLGERPDWSGEPPERRDGRGVGDAAVRGADAADRRRRAVVLRLGERQLRWLGKRRIRRF